MKTSNFNFSGITGQTSNLNNISVKFFWKFYFQDHVMVYVRNINNINLQNTKRASNFIDMVDNRQGWINRVKTYVSSQFICFSINNHNWELFPPATGWTKRRPGCSLTLEMIWWLGEWSSVGAFTGMAITFNNLYTGCPKNVTVVFYHKGRGAWT